METIKKQSKPSPMRLAVGACSLVLMLSCAPAGLAQQGARNHSAANQPTITATGATAHLAAQKAAEEEEETAKPAKPGSEGIKIHGHWVIDVRNPDGTLAAHRDFHNSLVTLTGASYGPTGDQILAALLSGNTVPGDPAILFVFRRTAIQVPIARLEAETSSGVIHSGTLRISRWCIHRPGPPT